MTMTRLDAMPRVTMVAAVVAAAGLMSLTGCDDEPPPGHNDGDAGPLNIDEGDVGDDDVGEGIDCEPGEIVECLNYEDGTYQVCNADGDGYDEGDCPGTAVCEDGECIEVDCQPGSQRCVDEGEVEVCEADGDGGYEYAHDEFCEGDAQTCEQGQCLDRCGIAELEDSYVGCEYWALETDNRLLHTDDDGSPSVDPEHRPPFAVVLTNTYEDVTAEITVDAPDGEVAESIPSREVRSHRQNPGDEFETVHSETVDADGNRIGEPHDGPIEDVELPPGATLTLLLPNKDVPFGETTVSSTAYRVESTEPVVAYQFNPFCCNYNYTNDASMLMPASALTENYMMTSHAVWAREETASLPEPYSPTLSVVAMEPDTTVEVQLTNPVFNQMSSDAVALDEQCPAPPGGGVEQSNQYADQDEGSCMLYPVRDGDGIDGPDATGQMEVTLDEHEVLNVAAGGAYPSVDLTGALVEADKEVAAFGAHTCVNVPFTRSACDHVESQLFPLETWGERFMVAPHKIRNPDAGDSSDEGTYWKVVSREDGNLIDASISIDPSETLPPSGEGVPRCSAFSDEPEEGTFVLDRGEYCEFGTREPFEIQSRDPINIAGFMSGQNTVFDQVDWGDHAGDPSMFMVPPHEQYRTEYTFLVPPTYHDNFMTVVTQVGQQLVHNGESVDPSEYDDHVIEGAGYQISHIPVEPGPHRIESEAGVPFGLIVYGFDNYVSYSYTGGLDLTKDSPFEQ